MIRRSTTARAVVRHVDDSRAARSLALLFLVGGSFAVIALALPHPPGSNIEGIVMVALIAFASAATLAFIGTGTCPLLLIHAALAGGTSLISLAIYYWRPGEVAGSVGLLYVWVVLYAFYFFPRRMAVAHTAYVAVAYGVTLAIQPGHRAPLTVWMVTVGTATVAGALIGSLVHRLEDLADTDALTGLPNRRAWERFAAAELSRSARYGHPVSVALIDVDHFKEINDQQGHQIGDRLLQRLASCWRGQMREGDLLGRMGGDEFAVVLAMSDREGVEATTSRLLAAVPGHSCTMGVACWDGTETLEQLLGRADAALYRGKQGGRSQAVFADGPSGAAV